MCTHPFAKEALTLHLARSEGVVSKNTNELNTRAPGRFGLDVSTLGSPMEARILGYEHTGPAVIRKKETRPEAADYGRSKLRNQRRIDFLRSTGARG